MDIRLLRAFLAVNEERHFGRAANRLNLSTPSLSQRIHRLEQQAGTALFERAPFGLTRAGEAMLQTAHDAVRAADAAARQLATLATGQRATLRVGVLSHGAGALTAAAIRAFRREEPGVVISIHGIDFPDTISAITEQRVDVAFVRPALGDPRLHEQPVAREQRFAILPRTDERASLASVDLSELDHDTFLSAADGTPQPYRRFLHLLDDRNGERPRHVDSQCRRAEDFLTAVAAGLGIATTVRSFRAYYPWPGVAYVPINNTTAAATTLATLADDARPLIRRFSDLTNRIATTGVSQAAALGRRPR